VEVRVEDMEEEQEEHHHQEVGAKDQEEEIIKSKINTTPTMNG
jgi:hypothetical protein